MRKHDIVTCGVFDVLFRSLGCSVLPVVLFWSTILLFAGILHWPAAFAGNPILAGIHSVGRVQHPCSLPRITSRYQPFLQHSGNWIPTMYRQRGIPRCANSGRGKAHRGISF